MQTLESIGPSLVIGLCNERCWHMLSVPSSPPPPLPYPPPPPSCRLILYLSLFGFAFDPASQPVVKLARGSHKKAQYVQLLRVPVGMPSGVLAHPSATEGTQPSRERTLVWTTTFHGGHVDQWVTSTDLSSARLHGNTHTKDSSKLVKRRGDSSQRSTDSKSRRNTTVDEVLSNGVSHHEGRRESLVRLPATPEEIRTEVESMLEDVMSRVKQLLFNSVLCTYYTAFIPLQFVGVSGRGEEGGGADWGGGGGGGIWRCMVRGSWTVGWCIALLRQPVHQPISKVFTRQHCVHHC